MSAYASEIITSKKYVGNVVVQIGSTYFAIRQPDSGLVISTPYDKCIVSLLLNPSTIDIRRVTTNISSFAFRVIDTQYLMTGLVLGDGAELMGQQVRIFLGRSNTGMDFSEYFELPRTFVQKFDRSDNTYTITTSEQTSRMDRPIYADVSACAVDFLAATTIITMRDDISGFPTSGVLKIEDEFLSYAGVDLVNNRFTGCIRGVLNSIPADHAANTDMVLVETVTDNPISIILKLLISQGGGGVYDVLQRGLGIDETLIDIAQMEALRDDLFAGVLFTLSLYTIDSALTFIENELLFPNGLRLTNSSDNSKVSLAILDKAEFVEEDNVIDNDTITKFPKWTIDGTIITNSLDIQWDFNEGTNQFQKRNVYNDNDSITAYGPQNPLAFTFHGIKALLGGQAFVDDFASRLLERLSTPTPIVTVNTQIDKSLQQIGDKAYLVSDKVPAADGTLDFDSNLEIVARTINQTTGDVQFDLAYTSFTQIRSGFIAPSDLITSIVSQSQINVVAGRGQQYRVGWYMLLWDEVNQVYCADSPNKIIAIDDSSAEGLITEGGDNIVTEGGDEIILEQQSTEDSITFENSWTTVITSPNNFRIRFVNYDDATDSQKRYGFISDAGNDFADGKPTYRITF